MHSAWPAKHRQVSRIPHQYWDMRVDLTSDNSLFLKDCSIFIPPALRESFLHDLHERHTGTAKYQLTAISLIHWPGIDRNIAET